MEGGKMIIDAHTHMFHTTYLEYLAKDGGDWGKKKVAHALAIAKGRTHLTDVGERLAQMERNSIDLQVITPRAALDCNLFPGNVEAQLAVARELNDSMARLMEESKGKLIPAGGVPIAGFDQGSRQEMERAIHGLGLKAFSIPSNINGKAIDLPEYEAFWGQAAEMGVPVYIHPVDPASHSDRSYEAEYDLIHNFGWPFETILMLSRLVFSGIMERYPTLKVISHHLGGGLPFFWGRINETYDPASQETNIGKVLPKPLFDYFSLFYYDTAVGGGAPAIRCAYEVFGADQLIFATDAPWGPGKGEGRLATYPNVIRSLGLPEADNKKIFADNIRRVLNIA
jgi:aminocarboxymuconate-semialdehyde decarboxylase